MNFAFTDEQQLIQKTVREFAQKEIAPRVREIDDGGAIPADIIRSLADIGLLGMTVSSDHGGAGADPVTVGVVAEELARADISCAIPTFFLVEAAWGHLLEKYGRNAAQEVILPQICRGQAFLGIAATEPDVGTDLANMKTVAVKRGDGYVLNGEKMFISGIGEIVDQLPRGGGYVTLAKTDPAKGSRGMSLFYIPVKDTKGVTTTTFEDWGRRGISAGGFTMEDVRIPADHLIGEENRGFQLAMEGFDYARAIISVVCAGAASSVLEQAMEHLRSRKVFGQPIGRFEGVQFKLAEHWARLEALKLLGYKALWMYGGGRNDAPGSRFEVTRQCAAAKMLGPQLAFEAINDAIQWHGAFGYTVDCPLELALKGVRSYYWAEGALEIMNIIVARELLGKEYVAYR
jgi:acyl-CoA dehydrogenase